MFDNRLSEINSKNNLDVEALKSEFSTSKKIVKTITHHPHLFKELCNSIWFINLIDKFKIHIDLALINEEIAFTIFNNKMDYRKLDKNQFTKIIGGKYENVALKIATCNCSSNFLEESSGFS